MRNTNRFGWIFTVVICGLAAAPARALFGIGDKDKKPAGSTQPSESLPGMEGAAPPQPSQSSSSAFPAPRPDASESRNRPAGSESKTSAGPQPSGTPAEGSNFPSEVEIKGHDAGQKVGVQKPPLNIEMDPFESIRDSLSPDQSLLLAESPYTVSWRHTYPEFLRSPRVIQPWRTIFSERPGIVFNIRDQLQEAVGRPLEPKEVKSFQWSLTIADEEGRVFQHYEGSKDPPEEMIWTGQNDQGEWIKAGRSYSAVYMFTDAGGSPRTKVGKPVQFTGITHQESDGLHISLDSSVLFGATKSATEIEKQGKGLLRAAADLVKRRFSGIPIRVQSFASTRELAEAQANKVADFLRSELMMTAQNVSAEPNHASFSEQRIEILLLNR